MRKVGKLYIGRDRHPECPLCDRKMREIFTKVKGKLCHVWACTQPDCMVWIDVQDPCVGKWQDIPKKDRPKCPLCGDPLNYFFRSDKFIKMQCPSNTKKHNFFQILRGRVEDFPKEMR